MQKQQKSILNRKYCKLRVIHNYTRDPYIEPLYYIVKNLSIHLNRFLNGL